MPKERPGSRPNTAADGSAGRGARTPVAPLAYPITVSRNGARVLVTMADQCEQLGPKQSRVLWRLVEAAQNPRSPWVPGQQLLDDAGSEAMHISQLFRSATKRRLLQLIVSDRGVHRILRGQLVDGDTYEVDEPTTSKRPA